MYSPTAARRLVHVPFPPAGPVAAFIAAHTLARTHALPTLVIHLWPCADGSISSRRSKQAGLCVRRGWCRTQSRMRPHERSITSSCLVSILDVPTCDLEPVCVRPARMGALVWDLVAGAAGHSSGAPSEPVQPWNDTLTPLLLTNFDIYTPEF